MKRFAPYLLVALSIAVVRGAMAAPPPYELKAWIDADTVGVGDTVELTVRASSGGDAIEDPKPGATPGFRVTGTRVEPNESITIINGAVSRKRGLVATFALQAVTAGVYTLGPASVQLGNQRVAASPIKVKVVPTGQAPPRKTAPNRGPFGSRFSPFDPWRDPFGGPDDGPFVPVPQLPSVPVDPRLAIDAPRGESVFLHATLDKRDAVVGEQVVLSEYIYRDIRRSAVPTDPRDATADFIRRTLMQDPGAFKKLGYAESGGAIWEVYLFDKAALFPLKMGDLSVGPMSLAFAWQGVALGTRQSETLHVRVSEPPLAGRPAGYTVGDVGKFELAANVGSREVEEEEAISVDLQISGAGNLPSEISPPPRDGIEWMYVQKQEKVGPMQGDKWGGSRTFSYLVKPHRFGTINLGEWSFSYWNSETRRYVTARAPLGTISVKRRQNQDLAGREKVAASDPFAGLPSVRERMGAPVRTRTLSDSRLYWFALMIPPLAYAFAAMGSRAVKRAKEWREAREVSPARELKMRLLAAEEALARGDARGVDSAIARVLEAGARLHLRTEVRGAGPEEFARTLTRVGIAPETVTRCETLLKAGEAARFAQDVADPATLVARLNEARSLVRRFRERR